MRDWIGLSVILLIVLGGLYWLMRANQPHALTQEEYEKRLRESIGRGLVSGAGIAFQKFLDPAAEKAIAVQNDLRAGHYDAKQESGDDDDKNETDQGEASQDDEKEGESVEGEAGKL
jgi:hypothetical protein